MATHIFFGKFHPGSVGKRSNVDLLTDIFGKGGWNHQLEFFWVCAYVYFLVTSASLESFQSNDTLCCVCSAFWWRLQNSFSFFLRFELDVWNSLFPMNWCLNNSYFWPIRSRVVGSYPFASSHFHCKNLTFLVYHQNLFRTDSSSTFWSAGDLMVDSGHHSFGFKYLHSLKPT